MDGARSPQADDLSRSPPGYEVREVAPTPLSAATAEIGFAERAGAKLALIVGFTACKARTDP